MTLLKGRAASASNMVAAYTGLVEIPQPCVVALATSPMGCFLWLRHVDKWFELTFYVDI